MNHKISIALLIGGLAVVAIAAEPTPQPDALSHQVPGYFFAAGRSYLGVDIRDVTTDRMAALKLKDERGVEITMVDADAPAGNEEDSQRVKPRRTSRACANSCASTASTSGAVRPASRSNPMPSVVRPEPRQ